MRKLICLTLVMLAFIVACSTCFAAAIIGNPPWTTNDAAGRMSTNMFSAEGLAAVGAAGGAAYTADRAAGTVLTTSVVVNGTAYYPTSGVVNLGTIAGGGGSAVTNFSYYRGIWPQYISGNTTQVLLSAGEQWSSNRFLKSLGNVTSAIASISVMTTVTVYNCYADCSRLLPDVVNYLNATNHYWSTGSSTFDVVSGRWVNATSREDSVIGCYATSDDAATVTNFITVDYGRNVRFLRRANAGSSQGRVSIYSASNPDGTFLAPNVRNTDILTPSSATEMHMWVRCPNSAATSVSATELAGGDNSNVGQNFVFTGAAFRDDSCWWLELGESRTMMAAADNTATELTVSSYGFGYVK